MSAAERFFAEVDRLGYDFFTGVPCSLAKSLFRILEREPPERYVPAVREDVALGLAAGCSLAGRKAVVIMQNSGLGVSVNALASLHWLYRIPALLLITWRGHLGRDAPEHHLMGEKMHELLATIEVPAFDLGVDRLEATLREADARLGETRRPVALVVKKGIF